MSNDFERIPAEQALKMLGADQPEDPWAESPVNYSTQDVDQGRSQWEPPVPLDGRPPKPTFPTHALPEFAREYCLAVAEAFQVPVSYAATLVLGATSTATLKRLVIDPGRGPVCALNEFFATVLESGSGKSSALGRVFGPLYRWERLAAERAQVPEGQANEVGILSSDPTAEALEGRLKSNDGRFAIANAEAADLFQILAGRYASKGSTTNFGVFLKGYSGEFHRPDRVIRGLTLIREPRLVLTLALQPSAWERVAGSTEFRERGFLARFLIDVPDSLLGRRKLDPVPVRRDLQDRWASLLGGLLSLDPPRNDDRELEPFRIPVSPQANGRLRDFRVWAEAGLLPDGFWEGCREFGARAEEHLLKLTGLLHCLRHPGGAVERPVSEDTLLAGIELFKYYAEHVRQAAGSTTQRRMEERLEYILSRIRSRKDWQTSFKVRDLYQMVKRTRGFGLIEHILSDLDRLADLGYLSRFEVRTGGRPSICFRVSPWVHNSGTHPQNPQSRAKPYATELKPGGEPTPNVPQKPPFGGDPAADGSTEPKPFGGSGGMGVSPSPPGESLMGKGSNGEWGFWGSVSENDDQGADQELSPEDVGELF